eukprot:TRINITY_DN4446_c0_g1_i1.p2 TRINITY_DN4446_c0_g1~~TRINITY_DN4446_c0_g1_i1.p2  ORF type:complete len:152 (+),score=22.67 TRINITY_DN4446_c0_g1_i1:141-596(+)
MINTPKSMLTPTRNSFGGRPNCKDCSASKELQAKKEVFPEESDFYDIGSICAIIGPASYTLPDNIGSKQIKSSHPSSLSYSFCKTMKDIGDESMIMNGSNRKSRTRSIPGPAHYSGEALVIKSRAPSFRMPHSRRFPCPGQFYFPQNRMYH